MSPDSIFQINRDGMYLLEGLFCYLLRMDTMGAISIGYRVGVLETEGSEMEAVKLTL
jgi:hypothetical protein